MEERDNLPIFPGGGGLNTELDPVLLDAEEASDVRNVSFDRTSLRKTLGLRKLHHDRPRLAGVRFRPRPIGSVAAKLDASRCPYAILPYLEDQDVTGTEYQIDVSFRLNAANEVTLTGESQGGTNAVRERFGAPEGGEFQFQPLVSRGGTDVEELSWTLGLAVVGPGFDDAVSEVGLPTPDQEPLLVRPVFYWWDPTITVAGGAVRPRMRFAVADVTIVPGIDYHLTLQLGATEAASQWFVNGVAIGQRGVVAAVAPQTSEELGGFSPLPAAATLDTTYRFPLYLARPMTRAMGVYPHARLFRGVYGLSIVIGDAVAPYASLLFNIGELQGRINGNVVGWSGYYARCVEGRASNVGKIRKIASYDGIQTLTLHDAFPDAIDVGDRFDIIPPMEASCQDVTIQELRIWSDLQTPTVILLLQGEQVFRSLRESDAPENYGARVGARIENLVGYWHLSDDGSSFLEDRSSFANHGWFASSPAHPTSIDRSLTLDGQRTALQYSLDDEQVYQRELQYNLGLDGAYRIHGRISFQFCRDLVPRNCWRIDCDENGGTAGHTFTLDDQVNPPVVFTIVASGAVGSQVNRGTNGSELAANLASVISARIVAGALGVHVFPVEAIGSSVYLCTIDPVQLLGLSSAGASFTVESGIERSVYETIFDWDNPEGEEAAPIFSLRWAHHNGARKFFIVWNTGREERFHEVAATPDNETAQSIQPHIGRIYTLFFGVQTEASAYHRLYVLVSDGRGSVRGWQELATGIPIPSAADFRKNRISWGASVLPQTSAASFEGNPLRFGAGTHNAALLRVFEAGIALRPFIKTPFGGGSVPLLGTNPPPIDRWTSLDRLVTPDDVAPRITEAASLITLTLGERQFTSTSGADWSSDVDGIPVPGYLLVVQPATLRRLRKNQEAYYRPLFVHVASFSTTAGPTTTGELTEPWQGRTVEGVEVRIAAYLIYVAFDHELQSFPLTATPEDDQDWAVTDIYPDDGVLGSISPTYWKVALLPTSVGVPQQLYAPAWDAGLVRGCEPVLGLREFKRSDGLRRLVMAVKGSIYDVRARWVYDNPFPSEGSYSFHFQNISAAAAGELEEVQDEILRDSRRTDPAPLEFFEVENEPSGNPCRWWIPNNEAFFGSEVTFWRMLCWVKLDDLSGVRTLSSRVGGLVVNVTGVSGAWRDLRHQVNHWFGLADGAPFLEIRNNTSGAEWTYRLELSSDTKVRIRDLVSPGRWVQLGFQVALRWGLSTIDTGSFFINGRKVTSVVAKTTGSPTPQTIPALPLESGRLGAYGSNALGTWLPLRYGLGGRMSRCTLDYSTTEFDSFVPAWDIPADLPNVFLRVDLAEGRGIRSQTATLIAGLTPGSAIFRGRGALPLASGFLRGSTLTSFAQLRERLYGTNGRSPVWEYDGETIVRAGLAAPTEAPAIKHERREIRKAEQGAAFPEDLTTGQCTLAAASPHLTVITGWAPSEADVGKLVVVPSELQFQSGASSDGPDYIGIISGIVNASLGTVTLRPAPTANQAGTPLAFMVFDAKTDDVAPFADDSHESALAKLKASTPYSLRRLVPHGTTPNTIAKALDTSGVPVVTERQKVFAFRGNHAVEIRDFISNGTEWPEVGQDTVLDFKCYIRFEEIQTSGGAAQILFERRDDPDTASWELAVIDQGRLRFRFWDTAIEDWRSIETVGRIFTADEWYYFRFRYRFKAAGGSVLDQGWEPDSRYEWRDTAGTARRRYFRDVVSCWACENKNPADPFLVLPGTHNGFNENTADPTALTRSHSRSLGNVGYPLEAPWMGPQRGDPRYSWPGGFTSPEQPVAFEGTFAVAAGGPDGTTQWTVTFAGALELYAPRWWSVNRDEPWHDTVVGGKKQINQAAGNYYSDRTSGTTRANAGTASLHRADKARGVLCYVYGTAAGSEIPWRILAVKHVGTNDINPISATRDGIRNDTNGILLTDDPVMGGDGLGALNLSHGAPTGYVLAFALPNGKNHSPNATGNTRPLPTLLVQGTNPVGVGDRPVTGSDAVRVGGPARPDFVRNGLLGLRAEVGDLGFSYHELDRTSNLVLTADHMEEDVDFCGPVDTRIGALPYLQFKDNTNASQVVAPGQDDAVRATWSMRPGASNGFEVVTGQGEGSGISGRLLTVDDRLQNPGQHRMVVTFFDPDRLVESPASPEGFLEVDFDPEEETFIASESKLVVTLPMSADRRRRIWRRIYLTLPDGSVFLSAPDLEIRDNRTRVVEIAPSAADLENSDGFDFRYSDPPLCTALAVTEQRMIFAGLLEAPNVIAWSDASFPERVPGTNRELLESGEGNPVVGVAYVGGQVYAFKRDSIFLVEIFGPGVRVQRLQANTGALSHGSIIEVEDNVVILGEKGVYAFDGAARVYYMSPKLEGLVERLDSRYLGLTAGAYDRRRNQILFTARERAYGEPRWIVTGEIPDSPMSERRIIAWSRQFHPQGVTALASVDDPGTDAEVIIVGTSMGFAMQAEVDHGLRGYEAGISYGANRFTISSYLSGLGQMVLSSTIDTEEDSVSGVPFIITRTTNGVPVLVAESWIYKASTALSADIARPDDVSGILPGDTLHLGGWDVDWRSKWFDGGVFTRRKQNHYLDLIFEPEVGGVFVVELYRNRETTPVITRLVTMDKGWALIPVGFNAAFFQFRIRRFGNLSPLQIYSMNLRSEVETQRGAPGG